MRQRSSSYGNGHTTEKGDTYERNCSSKNHGSGKKALY